jgi:hypothetical protein
MPFIESGIVPDTVQLMVLVAGLCSCAPALDTIRPAGIAPLRRAHKKSFKPFLLSFRRLGFCKRFRDPLVSVIDVLVESAARLGFQSILLVPNINRSTLEGDFFNRTGCV